MISNTVRFWLYVSLLIPSVICTLFAIIYLLINRTLRNVLTNHIIIIILSLSLISQVTYYPWMLYYYQYKGTWRRAQIFCLIWGYLDWCIYITQAILFAWATIERHILIFHDRWVSTKKKRFIIHYIPPLLILLYCFIFYFIFWFFPPCRNNFYNSDMLCLDPCITYNSTYSMYETFAHLILPALIIIVFSIALFVRVLVRKRRVHGTIEWRKHQKLAIQVLSISILYLVCLFPYALYCIMYVYKVRTKAFRDFEEYAEVLAYCMTLLLPFVCILSLPELRTKFIKILHLRCRTRRIGIETITVRPTTKN
ncbi:unnamed protein product [Adineta steineri]|uniref:G-protein coupled receptors family 1 profile domain-containing protein n=1 Tax=Adineta steineri TaxID=433720 RepID=A0A813VQ72_9BILA|nr:unnamed protein product [Adineta steineri]CAF1125168.1 unnamed protein product [Adineta steineri]